MTGKATDIGKGNLANRDQKDAHLPQSENAPKMINHAEALATLSRSQAYNRAEYHALEAERKKTGDTGGAWGSCILTPN